jgi:predicted NBD/HSP70 family sugar kinase
MTATEATAYNYIRRGVARTRAELARVMCVSRPTASTVSESLIASGLLRDGGKCQTSGGRSPTLLIPCPDAFSLIGAEMGEAGRLIGVCVDALGGVIGTAKSDVAFEHPEEAAEKLLRLWEQLDPDFAALGIGVALPEGRLRSGTERERLVKALRRHLLGKYIHICGRMSSAALSEGFCGGADPCRDYMLLSWGEGVEAVVCIGGRPFAGAHQEAGNLRRLPVSGSGVLSDVLNSWSRAATRVDTAEVAEVCAAALRCVLAILDPGAVVLSGRFSGYGAEFFTALKQRLGDFDCRIVPARYGEFSAARGAALQTHFSI